MKRLGLVLALAGASLAGAATATAATSTATEAATRAGLEACVLVDEARKVGVDPAVRIPATVFQCRAFLVSLRVR